MDAEAGRHEEQLERFGELLQSAGFEVGLLSPADGHPSPALRIHLDDAEAELVCLYSPLGQIDGLEDLDLLNLVLTRAESAGEHRAATESVIAVANELSPFGYFGIHADGNLFYRAHYPCERGTPPDVAAFVDSLKLVAYADDALRPAILAAMSGAEVAPLVEGMRS